MENAIIYMVILCVLQHYPHATASSYIYTVVLHWLICKIVIICTSTYDDDA